MAGTFDLKQVPADQLVAFYGLCFAAAAADGSVEKDELMSIFETMDLSPLSERQRETVLGYVVEPPNINEMIDRVRAGCNELRFAVVVGVVEVALADDVITKEEDVFLKEVCRRLSVNMDQLDAIVNFVREARRVSRNGVDNNVAEKAMKSAAAGLTSVGVPIAAVYFGGSVVGLSAAGITSGLAALGLGFGMVPGIGVAILVGTGVFVGVRWFLGDSKTKKEADLATERERKAQLVIKNLQDTINGLLGRIAALEVKASESAANREAIDLLHERLNSLRRALEQRKQHLAHT